MLKDKSLVSASLKAAGGEQSCINAIEEAVLSDVNSGFISELTMSDIFRISLSSSRVLYPLLLKAFKCAGDIQQPIVESKEQEMKDLTLKFKKTFISLDYAQRIKEGEKPDVAKAMSELEWRKYCISENIKDYD